MVRSIRCFVAGSPSAAVVHPDPALVEWLQRVAPATRRYGSVCAGAFLLAAAGSARWQADHDALGRRRATGEGLSCGHRGSGCDPYPGWPIAHVGRRHRRSRPGSGPGRGGSGARHRHAGRGAIGDVFQTAGRADAVQPQGRDRAGRPRRPAGIAALGCGQSGCWTTPSPDSPRGSISVRAISPGCSATRSV